MTTLYIVSSRECTKLRLKHGYKLLYRCYTVVTSKMYSNIFDYTHTHTNRKERQIYYTYKSYNNIKIYLIIVTLKDNLPSIFVQGFGKLKTYELNCDILLSNWVVVFYFYIDWLPEEATIIGKIRWKDLCLTSQCDLESICLLLINT